MIGKSNHTILVVNTCTYIIFIWIFSLLDSFNHQKLDATIHFSWYLLRLPFTAQIQTLSERRRTFVIFLWIDTYPNAYRKDLLIQEMASTNK